MKRFIALVAAITFAVCSVNVGTAADEEAMSVEYYFNEDFETSLVDGAPETGVCNPKTNKLYVCEDPVKGGRSLRYEALTESDFFYEYSVSPKGDEVYIEFDIMYEDVGANNGTMNICFKDSANKEVCLLKIDATRSLYTGGGKPVANLMPGKYYSVCVRLSLKTNLADIYINRRKRIADAALGSSDFAGVKLVRFQLYMLKSGEKPAFYLDNVSAYSANEPVFKYEERTGTKATQKSYIASSSVAKENDVLSYMENTLALYVGQNKIAVNGDVEYLDPSDKKLSVFVKDDRAYVPVRFVSEALEYDVEWNEDTLTAVISDSETEVKLTVGSNIININGEDTETDATALISGNRMFVPVRAVCEAFGKKLTYDKSGLIVIADREDYFNFRDDLGVFRTLSGMLVFDQPNGSEMVELLKNNFSAQEHPRLFFDADGLEKIKYNININANMKQWASDVVEDANAHLEKPTLKYELSDGVRLSVGQDALIIIQDTAFAYYITGDTKYSDRGIKELINICSYDDWHPNHFLDTSYLMEASAVGYDWFYNLLSDSQRETVKNAIRDLGLKQIIEDYDNVNGRDRGYKWAQSEEPDNWNIVCNSCALVAAMAIADEEPDISAKIFEDGMKLLQKAVLMYAPDGAWYEGPSYWLFASRYYFDFIACLDSVYGDTFGYLETPGIAETGYYVSALSTGNGAFNFHDAAASKIYHPLHFFLSEKIGDPNLAALRNTQMKENDISGSVRDLIWYNPDLISQMNELNRDFYFRDAEVATMRSSWSESSSVFVGMHSGKVDVYHGHMDAGEFIIDGYGTRYAAALGAESYNLNVDEWSLYRNRAEGHNVIVLNPSKEGGQDLRGIPIIDRFESNDGCAYAITDLSSVYASNASSVKRGIKLTNNRSNIIIQDEIHSSDPAELYWFMHSACDIQVASDGKSAVISGDFKDMYVYLLEDVDGTFSVMEAQPLSTSPTVSTQNKNLIYKKLAFHAENVTDMTLAIGMQFVFKGEDVTHVYRPDVVPLDSWQLDENSSADKPVLTDIKINGETIKNFAADNYVYTYKMNYGDPIPDVTAQGVGKVDIKLPEQLPGYVYIKVTSAENADVSETYVIKMVQELLNGVPAGLKEYAVTAVSASDEPQPENAAVNTIDGDLSTRWSAQGNSDIVFDLGSVKNVSHLGLAVYQDTSNDGRKQYFDIAVSADGVTYSRVYSGESTGATLEKELFSFVPANCRYIKIECNGTSVGTWNSLTEVSIYGSDE